MPFNSRPTSVCCAAIVAVVLGSTGVGQAQSIEIKPHFKKGERRYIESETSILQELIGGPRGDMKFKIKRLYGVWQEAVTESETTKLHYTVDRALQDVDIPMMGGPQTFDTDDPDNADASTMLGPLLTAMVGGSFTVEIDKTGAATSIDGAGAIREKIGKASTGNMMAIQASQEFSDDALKNTWGDTLWMIYPNKKVSVGDTWTFESTRSSGTMGKAVSAYTIKLDRIEKIDGRKCAVITYTGTLKSVEGDAGPTPQISGKSTGEAIYDIEKGIIVRQEATNIAELTGISPVRDSKMKVNITMTNQIRVLSDEERAAQKKLAGQKAKASAKAADQKTEKAPGQDPDKH